MGSAAGWLLCPSLASAGGDAGSSFGAGTQGTRWGIPLSSGRAGIPQPGAAGTGNGSPGGFRQQLPAAGGSPRSSVPLPCVPPPPTVHPGVPGWHHSRRGDPEGGRHPLTAQRLLHDEVHGAGVRVRLGQRPALIHCCPGSLTRATCMGREGHGRGRRAQGLHCPSVRDGTLPGGCSLHPLHLQPRTPSRMSRGSFGGLWAEVGQICLLAAPAPLSPLLTGLLAPWWRDQSRDPRGTMHLSIAPGRGGQQEPGNPGVLLPGVLVKWGHTTPPPTAYPCFGGGTTTDPARGCQRGTARHGVLCARACVLPQRMCSAEGWRRGCWQVVTVFGGCRGCRQQPVTVCVIPAGAGDG